jgi:hypothetical protein
MSFNRKATNEQLLESYGRLGNIWKVAEEFGMCGQSVHERLVKLDIKLKNRPFSDDEKFFLIENYTAYVLEGKLQELADKLNRTKFLVCREARKYGLTDKKRPKKLLADFKPDKN